MSAAKKIESEVAIAPVMTHALTYAAKGWHVFPAMFGPENEKKSHKTAKYSNGNNWGATTDEAEIRRDFGRWPDAIGIVTGAISGIFVVEADTIEGHGVDGIASLQELEAKHGALPATLMGGTPTGSIHRYFKHPRGDSKIKDPTPKLGVGIDVKGDGGMVIAPPSMRPGMGQYKWLNNNPIADAPDWLIAMVKNSDKERTPSIEPPANGTNAPIIADELLQIDPDINRSTWFAIGCALFKELGDESGFALWNDWSSGGKKYKPREMEQQWHSIAKANGYDYSIDTIYRAYDAATMTDDVRAAVAMVEAFCAKLHVKKPPIEQTSAEPSQTADKSQGEAAGNSDQTKTNDKEAPHLIQSSAEFVGGFVPPDYLIDGWLQRRFVYSITGMTGHGKTTVMLFIAICAALGIKIDGREVEKCRVLFFAGENPDDIRMRWIKLCEEIGQDPADVDVFFLPGTPPISNEEIRKRIDAEAAQHGPFGLLIIDTSAAYFQGDEENSNTQLGNHARMMRSFVGLPGRPTVVVTCHPTKNPDMTNLLPRGGGAFLAEVDGNLVCIKGDGTVSIHWHGKFRGPDFAPILFKLTPGTTEKLKDKKGRLIWTITAAPISEAEKADIEDVGRARQNELLLLLETNSRLSLAEMAEKLGWQYKNGLPNTSLAYRMLAALVQDKLAVKKRGKITLTKAGKEEVAAAKKAKDEILV